MKFKTVLHAFVCLTAFILNILLFPLIGRLMSSPNGVAFVAGTLLGILSTISLVFICFKICEMIIRLVKEYLKNKDNKK
tara:strand:+ start:138 stop:374 length:237 start_codon:yes stop_codon:yes gene_type:complete